MSLPRERDGVSGAIGAALALALACGPKGPTGGESGGSGEDAEAGSSVSGGETGSDTEPTGTATGASETEEAACAEMCEAYAACWPSADVAMCQSNCAWWFARESRAMCRAAAVPGRLCLATLKCAELLGDIFRSDCEDELTVEFDRCTGGLCIVHGTLNVPGGAECGSAQGCNGLPALGVYCTGDTCTCMLDGVKGASCEVPEGACDMLGHPVEFSECCPVSP